MAAVTECLLLQLLLVVFIPVPSIFSLPVSNHLGDRSLGKRYALMKDIWQKENCFFPSAELYMDSVSVPSDGFGGILSAGQPPDTGIGLRACSVDQTSDDNLSFRSTLCETFFNVSQLFCNELKKKGRETEMEYLSLLKLRQLVKERGLLPLCYDTKQVSERLNISIMKPVFQIEDSCRECAKNEELGQVCSVLFSSILNYVEAIRKKKEAADPAAARTGSSGTGSETAAGQGDEAGAAGRGVASQGGGGPGGDKLVDGEGQPPVEGDGPADGTGRPQAGAGSPSAGTGGPADGTGRPQAGAGSPSTGTGGPADGTGRPQAGAGSPSTGTGGPADGTGRPQAGAGSPSNGTGGPADGTGRPQAGAGSPSTGTGGPADGTGRPQAGAGSPSTGTGGPAAPADKSETGVDRPGGEADGSGTGAGRPTGGMDWSTEGGRNPAGFPQPGGGGSFPQGERHSTGPNTGLAAGWGKEAGRLTGPEGGSQPSGPNPALTAFGSGAGGPGGKPSVDARYLGGKPLEDTINGGASPNTMMRGSSSVLNANELGGLSQPSGLAQPPGDGPGKTGDQILGGAGGEADQPNNSGFLEGGTGHVGDTAGDPVLTRPDGLRAPDPLNTLGALQGNGNDNSPYNRPADQNPQGQQGRGNIGDGMGNGGYGGGNVGDGMGNGGDGGGNVGDGVGNGGEGRGNLGDGVGNGGDGGGNVGDGVGNGGDGGGNVGDGVAITGGKPAPGQGLPSNPDQPGSSSPWSTEGRHDNELDREDNDDEDDFWEKTNGNQGVLGDGRGQDVEAPVRKPPVQRVPDIPPDGVQSLGNALQHPYEESSPSGHFMAYFITAVILCVAGYVIYHNKQKIFAIALEGRRDSQRRRPASGGESSSSAKYSKLQSTVEEVVPALEKSTSSKNYIY